MDGVTNELNDPNAECDRLYQVEADLTMKLQAAIIQRDGYKDILMDQLDDLLLKKLGMIDYLKLKVEMCDWHGVADAAMDIREIEAVQKMLDNLRKDVIE